MVDEKDNEVPGGSGIIVESVDFDELLELERAVKNTEEQLNRIAGMVYRLAKDQETFYSHERNLAAQIEAKRKDLIKRYKIDEKRQWKIDINTRDIVYTS